LARLHLEDDTHPVREEESTPDLAGRSTLRYNRHAVDEIRDAELRDDLSDVLFVVVVVLVVFGWRCVPRCQGSFRKAKRSALMVSACVS
jgi:hypothetical protein